MLYLNRPVLEKYDKNGNLVFQKEITGPGIKNRLTDVIEEGIEEDNDLTATSWSKRPIFLDLFKTADGHYGALSFVNHFSSYIFNEKGNIEEIVILKSTEGSLQESSTLFFPTMVVSLNNKKWFSVRGIGGQTYKIELQD